MNRKLLTYILSATFGLTALVMLLNMAVFVARATPTSATIVEKLANHYIVSFYDGGGNVVRARIPLPKVRGGARRQIEVGNNVNILYDPKKPTEAKRDNFSSLWLFPLLLGVIATVPIGILRAQHR